MLVLISSDINTEDIAGQKRLRKVAKECVYYGQRAQNSFLNVRLMLHNVNCSIVIY